jgi:hypothetical protein
MLIYCIIDVPTQVVANEVAEVHEEAEEEVEEDDNYVEVKVSFSIDGRCRSTKVKIARTENIALAVEEVFQRVSRTPLTELLTLKNE